MKSSELDLPTRIGLVATVVAALGLLVPPILFLSALVGIGFSGTAWRSARRRGQANQVAKVCTLLCATLLALIVIGSTVYAIAN